MIPVELVEVWKNFQGEDVLRGINLKVENGEILAIIGISGAGKTTILRIIAGLETPDRGEVLIEGKTASKDGRIITPPYQRKVGFIFQNLGLWEHMSVENHLRFVCKNKEKIEKTLDFFALKDHRKKKPYQLSGGQKQRLAIARTFITEPDIILLDEPFANLDLPAKRKLREEILKIKRERNTTFIYVTHDPTDLKLMADRIAVLVDGRIIQIGSYKEILEKPVDKKVTELLVIE